MSEEGMGGGRGRTGERMSEEQEDSRQSQMLPPLQQWLGPLGERLDRPLASHRRSAPQVQTCPAANRSFMGHRWQGCGQTGLKNTKTSLKLSSLSHTRHQTWPIIPMPRNSPEWRLPRPQIRLTSPKSLICLFKSYTHTQSHPRALALEFSKLSPLGPSPHPHLWKSFAPILLPCAGSHLVQGSQMPAALHQPTSGSPGEPAVITSP